MDMKAFHYSQALGTFTKINQCIEVSKQRMGTNIDPFSPTTIFVGGTVLMTVFYKHAYVPYPASGWIRVKQILVNIKHEEFTPKSV
jgi:hypothetical protein